MHPLLGRYSKDFVNESDLSHDISFDSTFDLTLPNHVHRLISSERPSGRIE